MPATSEKSEGRALVRQRHALSLRKKLGFLRQASETGFYGFEISMLLPYKLILVLIDEHKLWQNWGLRELCAWRV